MQPETTLEHELPAPVSPGALAFVTRMPRVAAVVAIGIGIFTLVGWGTGIAQFTAIHPALNTLKPNGAVAFVLVGAAIGLFDGSAGRTGRRRFAIGLALAAGIIGAATFAQFLTGQDFGIDLLIFGSVVQSGPGPFPGRIGPNTAIALMLLATAVAGKARGTPKAIGVADVASVGVLFAALIPLIGYAYAANPLGEAATLPRMPLNTTMGLFVAGLAVICVAPHGRIATITISGGPGGVILRRLIPVFIAVLFAVGSIRLLLIDYEILGARIGLSFVVGTNVLMFAIATGWAAWTIDRLSEKQERIQRALINSELRTRAIVDATFDGILVTQNRVVVDANAGVAAMFGYTVEELIGRPGIELVAESSRADVRANTEAGTEGSYEFTGKRKDGAHIEVESVVKVQPHPRGTIRIAALRDITAQRRLERQVRQAAKMEAVGQLAGGVAHDFNNLLTVISGYTNIILQQLPPEDARQDDLIEIRRAAESATSLTRQLLAFSRQQVLAPRALQLNGVVAEIERMLRRLIGEDVTLRTALGFDLPMIRADRGQLEQVIVNLAVNARDAMPNGGTLTIETSVSDVDAELTSEFSIFAPGRYVMLTVSDTGEGMDATTRARVFEPFFTTKGLGKGTGLGLSTVYGIVKQTGGYITVYSEPGLGTTFRIYLPLAEMESASPREGTEPRASVSGTETILLAEDSTGVRTLVRSILARQGYSVLEASDGPAAVDVAAAHDGPIALLLTDVVMPGMNGTEVAAAITSARPGLKVLFMSGYASHALAGNAALSAEGALIQKPFTAEALLQRVRATLDAA